ncbi:antirestriction protein ArdA [Tolypothrix sp. LEGE 11397]|uniref:antirestriction protein ArdA n=1 Tax=Tolypothrix sp. LEGE 11397 TaxID=2777971 RepID=UPI00187EBB35|nr:antirestriction protein ArdA [Tolypothrix sp. LEGE 11397]MBE9082859.1 antirestriction protein ArdA [Tolypothrix sp. LEGE 11397]
MKSLCKESNKSLQPEIYIADLAAYNAGYLHGKWIDATLEVDDIQDEIKEILKNSPVGKEAEEFAIHSYSAFWEAELGEYADLAMVVETARFINEHGRLGAKLISYCDGELERARESIENNYCGEYESVSDFAEQITEETTQIPESLKLYINYEKMAKDLEQSGDIFTIEMSFDEVHVFWSLR